MFKTLIFICVFGFLGTSAFADVGEMNRFEQQMQEIEAKNNERLNEQLQKEMDERNAEMSRKLQEETDLKISCKLNNNQPEECAKYRTTQPAAAAPAMVDWGAKCRASLQQAEGMCNMNNSQEVKGAMNMANGIKNQMENAAFSNLQLACNGMGKLSQMTNAGLTAFKGYCSTQIGDCTEVCKTDLDAVERAYNTTMGPPAPGVLPTVTYQNVEDVREMRRQCTSLNRNVQGAEEGLMKFMAMEETMKNCSLLTGNSFIEECKKNPAYSPLCSLGGNTDCSNPSVAASNLVCKCRANPALPDCGGRLGSGGGIATNRTDLGSTSGDGADAGNFGGPGGGFDGMPGDIAGGSNEPQDGSLNRGGAGKAGIGESAGTGGRGGGAGGAAGAGGSGLNAKIIGGYGYGGAAGGGGSGGGGYQPGNAAAGGRNGAGPNDQRVDLRQFLPGGAKDPSRGLAGISGPDGITGPNSDIWKKINTRYAAKTGTLLP